MPFLIQQVGRNQYFVINENTGRQYSITPRTKENAIKQYQVLTASGRGIVATLVNSTIKIRLDYRPKIRKFLELHGQDIVTRLRVGREPVLSMVKKFVNTLTFGGLDKMIKQKGYDDVFHLFLFIDLRANNKSTTTIKLEKNEVINLVQNPTTPTQTYWLEIDEFPENMTLQEFLSNGQQRMGKDRYFRYDAFNNNCQVYILNLIQAMGNGEYIKEDIKQFIYQDTATLEQEASGISKTIIKGTTNIAGLVNAVVEGKALKNKKRKKKKL